MVATLQATSTSCLQKAVQCVRSSSFGPQKSVGFAKSMAFRLSASAKLAGPVRASLLDSASAVKTAIGEEASKHAAKLSFVAFNVLMALPALAEEEKGKIFDFNLTLPIISVQFLILMFALDKIWFKPLGEFMDTRDGEIRKNLLAARDNTDESRKLREEAESLLRAARAEAAASINKESKKLAAELEAELDATRKALEKELDAALQSLEDEREKVSSALDAQVKALASEIVERVVPVKV